MPATSPKTKPPTSPTSVSSADSLDATIRKHSLFTRYLGGKFLSLYSVTVFLSSVALIALTCLSFVAYRSEQDSFTDTYLTEQASASHTREVEAFLTNGYRAKDLINNGVDFASIFSNIAGVESFLQVTATTPLTFKRYSLEESTIAVHSNLPDCQASQDYTCDSDFYISSAAQLTEYNLESVGPIWDGPDYVVSEDASTSYPVLTLDWKSDSDGSLNRLFLRIDDSVFSFSSDTILSDTQVWMINAQTGYISSSSVLGSSDLAELSTLNNGTVVVTPAVVPSELGNVSSYPHGVAWDGSNGLKVVQQEVSGTPFVVITGGKIEKQTNLYWYLLSSLVVAVAPVFATLILGVGYSLRLAAVRERKKQRAMELADARLAVQAMRESKLRQANIQTRSRK